MPKVTETNQDQDDLPDALFEHPLLAFSERRRQAIAAAGCLVTVPGGKELYRPGDQAQALYLVLEGEVEAFVHVGGEEVAVWVFGPGDSVGEHALLKRDRRRAAGARARAGAKLFEIPAEAFAAHLEEDMRAGRIGCEGGGPSANPVGLEVLRGLVLGGGADGCSLQCFEAGESVVLEGEPGDSAYFILHGEAEAAKGDQDLTKMSAGQCFGELAVLDGVARTATVTAVDRLVVLRVEAATFSRWVIEHEPLRALIAMQRQIYRGPGGASVTVVSSGTYRGAPCVTSLVHYKDGRKYSATKITDRESMVWTDLSEERETSTTVAYEKQGCKRTLHLAEDRSILRIEADGDLEGVAPLCARLIARTPLKKALEARFKWSGTLEKPKHGALLCACVGLTVEDANTMEPSQIRAATGAGSICGSCDKKIRALEPATIEGSRQKKSVRRIPESDSPESLIGMPYKDYVEKVLTKEIVLPKASELVAELEAQHPEVFESDDKRAALGTLSILARLGLTTALMVWCAQSGWYWLLAILWMVQAINLYGVSAVVHDLAHDACFKKTGINVFFGRLLSVALLSRFSSFRDSHLLHHRLNQSFEDPKVSPPSMDNPPPKWISWTGTFLYDRIFMKLPHWIQCLWVGSWMILVTAFVVMLRYEFSAFRKIRNRGDVIDTLLILSIWGGLVWAVGWSLAAMVTVGPLLLGYAIIATVFLTHASEYTMNSPRNDPDEYELMIFNINNLTLGPWVDKLGYYFHRYHVEHHLFPTLPYHRLKIASEFLERRCGRLLLPARRMSLRYLHRGYMDNTRHLRPIEIAGKTYWVGSIFEKIRFGQAQDVPILK